MDSSEADFDFGKFCTKYRENFPNEPDLKQLVITRSVMKLGDFYKSLQENLQDEAAQTTPTKNLGTLTDYAELFKVLDTYPSNLQRVPKKREFQRANSSTLKINDTLQDQTAANTSSPSVALSNTLQNDVGPTPAEVYNDFQKLKQKLKKVHEQSAALKKEKSQYLAKVEQLQQFTQQLEKLMPCEREIPDAFTASEEANLLSIAENMKQLNYLRTHSLSNAADLRDPNAAARLEILVDVLNYTLMQITCYNNAWYCI